MTLIVLKGRRNGCKLYMELRSDHFDSVGGTSGKPLIYDLDFYVYEVRDTEVKTCS